ncbi:molecular chaperone HtpG [bacterium endosymbiont of Bathymodiolus sp. 5 South]|jgi:molecular chaperone HtpG|uniref:molecular chaperone HtpG n=1 Tax=bacterium endosymbiont of Bathymodiolus sp. 5 South TaxID=1181670 RepID=UPI0010BC02CF|nr:molecular chaperone HtpG [bacterium endosymbiont of Bathymodiolus sp. 5 South]CAC9435090.1 Chaperone protein HtpG [uncultured Gammaproteobacteria bacterium]CAC9645167.1 Chaperone protein HtpG [uncultured Gammaproteobacteria bacterium]CAC9656463.1 Chaperone protein HtpG [uncultured Gammaproteobacteria bacterium]SHN90931.1 Chaperone protein HtpG [bacterium endosymbiont of Bathymodiolus sp. 5 South]SSC07440.1 Chaperone protein HtpG [bacterium endosymbiont of Bathymodiolus sp. 5 South]
MAEKQTHTFQTEVSQLLDLMIHSLYSNKEIFLRELVSNASDAIDKLKFETLSDDSLVEGKENLAVYIDVNKDKKTITITDNGIGMTETEVNKNIGTIANSGTKKFLKGLDEKQAQDSNLIGQFGVGFYSAFIVADKVTLTTRKAGTKGKKGTQWTSNGKGKYSTEKVDCPDFGTSITLHIKADEAEFLDEHRLRGIISKYSDHITVPIMMIKHSEDDKNIEYEAVNKANAFWTQDKSELKQEDYDEFYKSLTFDFEAPLTQLHNRVEGNLDYTSLLYIPSKAPFDMWEPKRKGGIKLYAKRVFIMEDNEELMPLYLRFVKGVIDTADLSLNVSREILQGNKVVDTIRKASVSRILKELEKMAKNKPEKYATFWKEFGMVMKEGVVEDFANKEKIAKLLRFATNKSADATQTATLECYVKSMQKDQKAIYYITAETYESAKGSPHLEIFNQKDIEVLLLSDRVDEWMVSNFGEFDGTPLKSIAKGDLEDLDSKEEKAKKEKTAKDFDKVIEKMSKILENQVKEVKISNRLSESPSCLVADENEMGGNMERIMKSLGQDVAETKPILEINPKHPLVKKLKTKISQDVVKVLFDQAVLSEGGQLKEPAEFVKRMNKLIK